MKEDLICYIKIFFGLFLSFPLLVTVFALDMPLSDSFMIAACIFFTVFFLGVAMFNYLEYGKFSLIVSK